LKVKVWVKEEKAMAEITPERATLDTGLLFTDGLPQHDDSVGYRGAIAARAAGISYRQLDYWARTSLVVPTVRDASGSGSQRLYGFRDILNGFCLGFRNLLQRTIHRGVVISWNLLDIGNML
jgi:hypothetical protein